MSQLTQLYRFYLVVPVAWAVLLNEHKEVSIGSLGQEDAPTQTLNLLQVSQGFVQASVDDGGNVDGMMAFPRKAAGISVVSTDANLKPSPLAFGDAEEEDAEFMHLLQTSRVVEYTEPEVEPLNFLQVNESEATSSETASADVASVGSSTQETTDSTIVLGPKEARESTVILAGDVMADADNAIADAKAIADATPAKSAPVIEDQPPATPPQASSPMPIVTAKLPLNPIVTAKLSHNSSAPKSGDKPKDAVKSTASLSASASSSVHKASHKKVHRGLHGNFRALLKSPHHIVAAWKGQGVESSMLDAVLALLVMVFFVGLLLLVLVGAGKVGKWVLNRSRNSDQKDLRGHIEGMPRCPGLDVVNQLIAGSVPAGGCVGALERPLASKQLIRLEGRVEESASGFCMWTPLTQQACVRFNATVSRQEKGSSLPVPMSYQCSSIDFVISLLDAPHVRIEIEGRHLSTFDMSAGRMSAKRTFDSAARHWQEFAMTSQIGGKSQPASRFRSEHSVLEFQETAIVLGTRITVVGELHKNAVGALMLRPLIVDDYAESGSEPWRTSWEAAGLNGGGARSWIRNPLATSRKPWLGKVWVSDDPMLLGTEHKHAKYDPTASFNNTKSRDCTSQLTEGVVNLISPGGLR